MCTIPSLHPSPDKTHHWPFVLLHKFTPIHRYHPHVEVKLGLTLVQEHRVCLSSCVRAGSHCCRVIQNRLAALQFLCSPHPFLLPLAPSQSASRGPFHRLCLQSPGKAFWSCTLPLGSIHFRILQWLCVASKLFLLQYWTIFHFLDIPELI